MKIKTMAAALVLAMVGQGAVASGNWSWINRYLKPGNVLHVVAAYDNWIAFRDKPNVNAKSIASIGANYDEMDGTYSAWVEIIRCDRQVRVRKDDAGYGDIGRWCKVKVLDDGNDGRYGRRANGKVGYIFSAYLSPDTP